MLLMESLLALLMTAPLQLVVSFFFWPDTRLSDRYPIQSTSTLVDFLQSNNETTTHFMIGSNILQNPSQFSTAFGADHDIAVHTFTHPYMTTKSNLDVVAEVSFVPPVLSQENQLRILTIY
jgi:chitin deacetylase